MFFFSEWNAHSVPILLMYHTNQLPFEVNPWMNLTSHDHDSKWFISSTEWQNICETTEVFSELGWLISKKIIRHIVILIILMHEPTGQLIEML